MPHNAPRDYPPPCSQTIMLSNGQMPYGGQAVIEGVMMRGAHAMAVAVRAPDEQIRLHLRPLHPIYRGRLSRVPFIRGLLGLWDALALGWESLSFAAEVAGGTEAKLEGPSAWAMLSAALALAFGLFLLAPAALAHYLETALGLNAWWSSLLEGLLRLGLFVVYLWGIGRLPDIRRVYAYHGAEHKTINAFEAGTELTPSAIAPFPRDHPRCGTAFILTVALFSILLFALLGPLPFWGRLAGRILLLPVLAGLAYEYLRFTARYYANPIVRALVAPSMALQRLTTREPDEQMLAVALAAFEALRTQETKPLARDNAANQEKRRSAKISRRPSP